MGRHSRRGPAPQGSKSTDGGASGEPEQEDAAAGKRRRANPRAGQELGQRARPEHGGPAGGAAQVRGGHPEQRESGGGWGPAQRYGDPRAAPRPAAPPRQKRSPATEVPLIPGPRREFLDAFEVFDAFDAPPSRTAARQTPAPAAYPSLDDLAGGDGAGSGGGPERPAKGGKGRAFTGIAAAAVITVLAVVVAGQVADGGGNPVDAKAASRLDRGPATGDASRSDGRPTPPSAPPVAGYEELMAEKLSLDPRMKASGDFTAVPGFEKAPGKGRKYRYRVDVENGLGLDGDLFAKAVQKTLNDDRSWAHGGAMTFERISGGKADFVVTLASPGTTAVWCAKSGLDTTVDNVSCDSLFTDRVMINAYRWAEGAETYGDDAMFSYREMLINHEVGHRLKHNHEDCETPGAPAPVMQQQTKSLSLNGIECEANPWPYPEE
ncbi:DUF3152 domain-containing protein [Streptomyces sp. NPDC006923]|uniref:DUF3152 domain-containing protein n=1 Tax=Streptomyces sp. NPDC006923 TaxID=3155355 RepID=UPI0033C7741A